MYEEVFPTYPMHQSIVQREHNESKQTRHIVLNSVQNAHVGKGSRTVMRHK